MFGTWNRISLECTANTAHPSSTKTKNGRWRSHWKDLIGSHYLITNDGKTIRLYRTAAILDWRHELLTPMRGHACKGQLPAIEETRRSSVIMPNRDHCCVPQCQNNRAKNIPNLTFHQFPSDKSIRKQWVVKIRRDMGKTFQVSWLGYWCYRSAHVFTINIMIWFIYR